MASELTVYDADELRDVADRSERGARTALETARQATDGDILIMLLRLAGHLEGAAAAARKLAARIDPEGEDTDE